MSCNNIQELNNKYNLEQLLNELTKNDLTDIRKTLDVKGVSKLSKKELVQVLKDKIQEDLKQSMANIDFYQYIFLDRYFCEKESINNKMQKYEESITALRNKGIVFPVKVNKENTVVIPEELENDVKENFINDEDFNLGFYISTDILKIVQVLLHYYGALTLEQLYEIISNIANQLKYGKDNKIEIEFDRECLINLLSESNREYFGIKKQDDIFYNEDVINLSYIIHGHKAIQYTDYCELSLNVIRKFEKEKFYMESLEDLRKYMNENLNIPEHKIDEALYSVSCMLKNAFTVDYVFEDLKGKIYLKNDEIENTIKNELNTVNENIKKWCLRGYSIKEIQNNQKHVYENAKKVNSKVKVGRNDPCPCGSGKKYKKCCLK